MIFLGVGMKNNLMDQHIPSFITISCLLDENTITLFFLIHSLQPEESIDWHRHGNTGGLRAESEVEKVLRVVHNFIKTNSKPAILNAPIDSLSVLMSCS